MIKMLLMVFFMTLTLPAYGGEISNLHLKNARNKLRDHSKSKSHEEGASAKRAITEIGIERTSCFGKCPDYIFIVKSDGKFRYKGGSYVERQGEYSGTIYPQCFNQLAEFIKESGFMELDDDYSKPITDNPTTYTMVVMDKKRKTVRNYAGAGPAKLWAIERLIDDLMVNGKSCVITIK